MGVFSVLTAIAVRLLLVLLFSFSALDKILNHRGAVGQASEAVDSPGIATALIVIGFLVEVIMSLGVITGIADRAAAFVLAGYCGVTALFWKQFWIPGDFWAAGKTRARGLFWFF
jgi:putative oxidoreductase